MYNGFIMEIIWILIGFFALFTMVFIVVAIFLPEWVGITGKKALEIQKHQHNDKPVTTQPASPLPVAPVPDLENKSRK